MQLGIIGKDLFTTEQHNPNVRVCATHLMDNNFVNLLNSGYARRLFKKKKRVNSDFAMTIWCFSISNCKYVLLLVQEFAIDCSNAEFCALCVCVCV